MPVSSGTFSRNNLMASRPPADAPIAATGNCGITFFADFEDEFEDSTLCEEDPFLFEVIYSLGKNCKKYVKVSFLYELA